MRNRGSQQKGANKGGSSNAVNESRRTAIHSWYIEEEEDPRLRNTFPDAEGHLFEVTLQRDGKSSLGVYIIVCDGILYSVFIRTVFSVEQYHNTKYKYCLILE